jgi:hypothetical protein
MSMNVATWSVLFSSVLFSIFTYAEDMDELEEARLREATMSHHEIMVRFKKLFGREMTPKERQNFFLPHDSAATEENPVVPRLQHFPDCVIDWPIGKLRENGETESIQDDHYCPGQGFSLETPSRQEKESLAQGLIRSLRLGPGIRGRGEVLQACQSEVSSFCFFRAAGAMRDVVDALSNTTRLWSAPYRDSSSSNARSADSASAMA